MLRTDPHRDWTLAPSHSIVHIRLPCPNCGWAGNAPNAPLDIHGSGGAVFTAVCTDHGPYDVLLAPDRPEPYIDLAPSPAPAARTAHPAPRSPPPGSARTLISPSLDCCPTLRRL